VTSRKRGRARSLLLLVALLGGSLACNRSAQKEVRAVVDAPFPKKLSDWHLFVGSPAAQRPNRGVLPYDLNTPLFSDYAGKHRYVWMPAGASARYRQEGVFDFPVGAILVKTFSFPADGRATERLVETRLLVHAKDGWVGLPYVWDDEQNDATLQMVPDPVAVKWTDAAGKRHDFTYSIPNANECHECHDNQRVMLPIGPRAANLNKTYPYAEGTLDQLDRWRDAGYLQGLPPDAAARPRSAKWDDPASGSLDQRARAYLENNCAHCHQPGGQAGYTGVDYRASQKDPGRMGACKTPNSAGNVAGLSYDLVPGRPEASILIFRLTSVAPKVAMPQLGRAVVHWEGVELLREWIASLVGECRPATAPAAAPGS